MKKRSVALAKIRHFFADNSVLEVDVPTLSTAAVADCYIDSLQTSIDIPSIGNQQPFFLHTSPEYAMKRLLCAGSGDIYFLGKVYRQGDYSPRHQPEFTMLEWYRLDYSLDNMMEETALVIQLLLGKKTVIKLTYQQAFQQYAHIENIHQASAKECIATLKHFKIAEVVGVDKDDKSLWEQLVFTEIVEKNLGKDSIACVYEYPAKDSALAKISTNNKLVAERFEVFVNGIELANGYLELQDSAEYLKRFQQDLSQRASQQKTIYPLDENLLEALEKGRLPNCSGVALGFDRLLMLAENKDNIQQVIPFSIVQ